MSDALNKKDDREIGSCQYAGKTAIKLNKALRRNP
jgi:hypothetical protein